MSEVKTQLQKFWGEILGTKDIDTADNFFNLGGHSLHAMRLKHFVNTEFKVNVSIKNIFENPTIDSLSHIVVEKMNQNGNGKLAITGSTHTANGQRHENGSGSVQASPYEILSHEGEVEGQELYPLSYGEERLWFLYQFQPVKSLYNIVTAVRIVGNLNINALELSFRQLLKRHHNLRKSFIEINGDVKAKIGSAQKFGLNFFHLNIADDLSLNENRLHDILVEEEQRPFDLSSGLPFRATVIRVSDQIFVLVFAVHHIVADAWSLSVIVNDLEKFYQANVEGKVLELPSLDREYRHYPIWQREFLTAGRSQELLRYWKEKLKGRITKLKLPYDSVPGEVVSYVGTSLEIDLPGTLISQLQEVAKIGDATLFMVFIATFHTLLYKYTNAESIVTGIPIAGRHIEETKDLIGFFVNTLLISTDFSADLTFSQLLSQLRNTTLDAYEHQAMPFEMLANELRKETGIAADSLFQVMFAFQNVPNTLMRLHQLETQDINLKTSSAKFDLSIYVTESNNNYKVLAEYRTKLFQQETIQRMLDSFANLLTDVAKDPGKKISALEWVNNEMHELIIKKWNATGKSIPDLPVHKIFEEQVNRSPEARAIVYLENSVTYREVNNRANQLAWHLLDLGIKLEQPVGILMEESDEAIVAELAIMKAGGAYLPLDPTYPKERLEYMLRNAQTDLVIINDHFRSYIDDKSFHVINLEKEKVSIARHREDNPKQNVRINNLSNVMYTSGSTGKPKGVALEHQGIVRLVMNVDYLSFNSKTRLLKTGAFSFDASTLEVWGTLLNGGELHLCARESLLDHEFLRKEIAAKKINTMWLTTSWCNQLVDIDPTIFNPLKKFLVGGDKLSPKHIRKLKQANPSLEVINAYGPTENSVLATYYCVENEYAESIPIGKPVPNSTAYVLGPERQLLPVGVDGEIYVGGLGVARGYINNPEMTGEKFVDDPFRPGSKMYRTGDAGRWLANGNIEFIGRKDNQIKLRGFRIEIGEIEQVFISHPLVTEAVVLLHGNEDKDGNLVGFYVSKENISVSELRSFLRKTLPEHMVPSQFINVNRFPLTVSGKVDKIELLKLINNEFTDEFKFMEPSNPIEQKLVPMWEEVLSRKPVSTTDSFFHMGGHSLLATRLMSKIKVAFNHDFQVSLLFKAPTIKELAAIISQEMTAKNNLEGLNLVPIQPKGSQPPLFVIPGYLFYYHLAKYLGDDQPLYGFEPIPKLSIEGVASTYIRQLKQIQPEGPYYIGGYCAGGLVAYEMARQLTERGEEIGLLALFEVYTPEGVVSKASPKYVRDRLNYVVENFRKNDFGGKLRMTYKELKKASRAIWNFFDKASETEEYTITPYSGPIKLFKAMERMVGSADDKYMGWSKYCPVENLEVFEVPGNHDTMFKEPHVPVLSRYVEACILESRKAMREKKDIVLV